MAVPLYAHWEVQTDGDDLNGGFFNPDQSGITKTWDDNYTYGPSYQVFRFEAGHLGPLIYGGANNRIRCASRAFVQADVGHGVNIQAGTSVTPGRYVITSVDSDDAILDANCWTASNGTAPARMGGAVANPGTAILAALSSLGVNFIWIKAGTYTVSSSISSSNWSWRRLAVIGYESERGDYGEKPLLQAGADNVNILHFTLGSDTMSVIRNIRFDGNGYSGVRGSYGGSGTHFFYNCDFTNLSHGVDILGTYTANVTSCKFENCTTYATYRCVVTHSVATNCTIAFRNSSVFSCVAVGGTNGYATEGATSVYWYINSIASGCSDVGFNIGDNRGTLFLNCIAYNCGGNGFNVQSRHFRAYGCIAVNNGGYGFAFNPLVYDFHAAMAARLAAYNNTSGNFGGLATTWGETLGLRQIFTRDLINLGANPFVDPDNGDFRLNDLPNGGRLCRGDKDLPFPDLYGPDLGTLRVLDPQVLKKLLLMED